MRVVLTGSSGRIGRAIFGEVARDHEVVGIDRHVFSTTHFVGDCTDSELLKRALEGADAVIHTAGPHAPHVGLVPEAEFENVNVEGTRTLFELARDAGVERFVYTSTTALYGEAVETGKCAWIDETIEPRPRTIYHRTKLAAEKLLEQAASHGLTVRVLRMSRCFPEPAPFMATYRLHRGIDARDVARAHKLALTNVGAVFEKYVVSGNTPFNPSDCVQLAADAQCVIRDREPELAVQFDRRGWVLPRSIDRVYSSCHAAGALGWTAKLGWEEVLDQLDRRSIEVLPPEANTGPQTR